jgi:hypothetical protein
MRSLLFCAAALAAAPGITFADNTPPPATTPPAPTSTAPHFGFSLEAAYEFGGADLATAYFQDGSTNNIRAGQGLTLGVGGNYRPTQLSPWDISLIAGYKFDQAGDSDHNIKFERIPIELIGSYEWQNGIRLGAGPVYHTNVKLDGGGFFPDVSLKNAFGGQVQVGWKWVALSYTFIRYEDDFGDSVDGGNWGIRFIGNF